MTTLDTVRRIAADLFSVPADSLPDNASPDTVEDWDSIQSLNLVLALEEEFQVQVDPEDLGAASSLEEIAAMVDKKAAS